jgi:hypothetical protein
MIDVLYYEPYERCKQCYYKARENRFYKFTVALLWCTAGVGTGILMVKYGVI